jgi:hypothetical protein
MASNLPPLTGDLARDLGPALPPLTGDATKDLGPAEPTGLQRALSPVIAARDAVGSALAVPFRLAGKLDVAAGIKTPEQAESRAKTYGDFTRDFAEGALVPWSKVPGLAGTALRAGQSGVLGAAQGLLEKGDVGDALTRGGLSAVLSPAAEGLVALGGKFLRSVAGAQGRIAADDAKRLGEAIGEISDPLRGAKTAADIQRLAGGEGQRRLSAAKEAIVQEIERATGNRRFLLPTFGEGAELTLREANQAMTKVGQRAFGPKKDFDLIQQYHAMELDLLASLDTVSPDLAPLFKAAQQEWMKGTYLLNFLALQPAYKELSRGGTELATAYLQKRVTAPKPQRVLREKLGSADYGTLVRTLKRGEMEGADVVRNTSPFSLRGLLASGGLGAAGGLLGGPAGTAAALVPYALPNALSTYVGRAPYALGPTGKAAAAFGGKAAADAGRAATREERQ